MHQTVRNMVRSMIFGSGLPLLLWGDAAEYVSYILNRSPKRGNAGCASLLQELTGVRSTLTDIVIFGSPCTEIRTPNHKTLDRCGEAGVIIGKSDENKEYRVLFTNDRVVRATQHVKNIKSVRDDANAKRVIRLTNMMRWMLLR